MSTINPKELLEFISAEGFVLDSSDMWYAPKRYNFFKRKQSYYTHSELVDLYIKERDERLNRD